MSYDEEIGKIKLENSSQLIHSQTLVKYFRNRPTYSGIWGQGSDFLKKDNIKTKKGKIKENRAKMFRNVEKNREILDTFEKNSFLDATITRNIGLE